MMRNILIVGGGTAGRKFVKALTHNERNYNLLLCGFGVKRKTAILSQEFGLPLISFPEINSKLINTFDCVIICVPLDTKIDIISQILFLGYSNALMIEKPLAISKKDCIFYQNLLCSLKRYYVCYWREFSGSEVNWVKNGRVEIVYPSVFRNLRDNIVHNLPHLLDWILFTEGSIDDIHIFETTHHSLHGIMNGFPMRITFSNPDTPVYKVNDTTLPDLNQQDAYCKMVDSVLNFNEKSSKASIQNSISIAAILEEVLAIYEHQRLEL